MSAPGRVRYVRGEAAGMELALCEDSTFSYPTHNHVSALTVGLVLDGALVLTAGTNRRRCEKGDVFVLPPYTPHSVEAARRYTLLSACVRKERLADEALVGRAGEELADLLQSVRGVDGLGDAQRGALVSGLCVCARTMQGSARLDALRQALELHPEECLSMDEMAGMAHMSKYELIRSFKRQVGLTPHQFQLQNRIRGAQRRLLCTPSLTEVALNAGFCDQSHFIRQFKRHVGMTPAAYRRCCCTAPQITWTRV